MKNKLFMKNFAHVLRQDKNRMLDGKTETFIDLMLESKDGEFAYLADLIDEAFSMTLSGTKYHVKTDEEGMYDPFEDFRKEWALCLLFFYV